MTEITEHSWNNITAHVLRKNGTIVRATLGSIIYRPNYIGVRVFFRDSGQRKTKLVSPLSLVALQMFWLNRDIVSDDEDDKDELYERHLDILPLLRIGTHALSSTQHEALMWIISQCDALRKVLL